MAALLRVIAYNAITKIAYVNSASITQSIKFKLLLNKNKLDNVTNNRKVLIANLTNLTVTALRMLYKCSFQTEKQKIRLQILVFLSNTLNLLKYAKLNPI